jgi:hypothetical protein
MAVSYSAEFFGFAGISRSQGLLNTQTARGGRTVTVDQAPPSVPVGTWVESDAGSVMDYLVLSLSI